MFLVSSTTRVCQGGEERIPDNVWHLTGRSQSPRAWGSKQMPSRGGTGRLSYALWQCARLSVLFSTLPHFFLYRPAYKIFGFFFNVYDFFFFEVAIKFPDVMWRGGKSCRCEISECCKIVLSDVAVGAGWDTPRELGLWLWLFFAWMFIKAKDKRDYLILLGLYYHG